MIELRTYEGDGDDVAELIARVWRRHYGGKSWCPSWGGDYLRWQLLADRPVDRSLMIGAYVDGRLAGCMFAKRAVFRVEGRPVLAAIGSWLTVAPETGEHRLALELVEELGRRSRESGLAFVLGFCNGDPATPAHKFWTVYSKLYPQRICFARQVGYWVRILNAGALRSKCLQRWEKMLVRPAALLQTLGTIGLRADGIRPFAEADLDRCAAVVEELANASDCAMAWSGDALTVQLGGIGYPHTLVLDDDRRRFGFINYHRLGLLGADEVHTGFIDLLGCESADTDGRRRLLRSAVARMAADGFDAAASLRLPMFPASVMLRCGFWPMPQSEYLVLLYPADGFATLRFSRPLVLFR